MGRRSNPRKEKEQQKKKEGRRRVGKATNREIAREISWFQRKQEMARRTDREGNRTEMKKKFNNKN